MNILMIGVLAVFLVFAASGWRMGLIRKLAGIVSLLLSAILVSAALPYITEFIKKETPVYQYIAVQCENVVGQQLTAPSLAGGSANGGGLTRERIKSLMEQYGMDSSAVDGMSDDELQILIYQYFPEYADGMEIKDTPSADLSSMTRIEQTKLIESLPLPDFLRQLMLNYNNSEGYGKLDVSDFSGYLVHFLANIVLNIVAFVITLLVVQIVLWTGLSMLNLFARLPVLHLLNRVGGLFVGVFQGLLAVWMIFLVISMLSGTEAGQMMIGMINSSSTLRMMYDSNLFLKIVAGAVASFM